MSNEQSFEEREDQTEEMKEIDLSEHSGVHREILRRARAGMDPKWFRVVPGVGVFWSAVAVRALAEDLERPELAEAVRREAQAGAAAVCVRVRRIPRNPTLLLCEDAHGVEVRVRVKRNDRFVPRMELPVRMPVNGGLAVLARKLPRRRGRW